MEDDNTTPTSATHREASDDEHDSKEKVLQKYFLQEWPLLNSLLDRIVSDHAVSDPSDVHTIRSIIDKYQEQGQLLEPYLETIIAPLMSIIRSQTLNLEVSSDGDDDVLKIVKPLCIIVYALVTVCGYKNVVRFFPHRVSDLELAVCLLEKCHYGASGTYLRQESTGEMETKCVVLLWLYILVLIPFDMSSVDTSLAECGAEGGTGPPPLVLKIIGLAKDYLASAGPMRRISGLLLSKLLTRPDMKDAFTSFCEWAHDTLLPVADNSVDPFMLLGILEALASTFKVGGRDILVNAVATIWSDIKVLSKSSNASHSSLIRKFIMKLSQRIGLACLPHRSPSWHYLVKKISLDAGMRTVFHGDMVTIENHEVEDDIDIPEIIEEIMEQLLSGLRDMDTVVRWSAAKGVGRITARLTCSLLEDVQSSILELFSPGEGDGSWHGGCLAFAELARRGLLLPSSLPKVVPVIVKALHYDIRRGPHSVGSHVRDAAAYVCWAFGRAYSLVDMKATLDQLAPHLLSVACYDREVNCRRAAAAAFQENVGRQGSFPNGIYIVNTADYFSLSSRTNSYLHVAVCISQFEEYLCPFAEELIYHKVPHWDKSLRELAAVALAALVKYKPEYFAEDILNTLTPQTLSSDLCMRHGATLAVGELVLSLHKCGFTLSAERQKSVSNIVPAIEDARLYRGKGGEVMRSCVSRFIECISLACVTLTDKSKKKLLNTLNENLKHPNAQIQRCAVDALRSFVPAYVGLHDELSKTLTSRYLELLKDPNAAARRGSALAIGSLPFEYLAPRWRDIMPKLCMSCTIQESSDDLDAEARVNAVYGLASVCETLTSKNDPIFDNVEEEYSLYLEIKNRVVHTLLKCLDDYAVDNRGDVGSWVREAAINGLVKCTKILCRKDSIGLVEPLSLVVSVCNTFTTKIPYLFCEDLASSIIGGIAKQAVEKLDKLRGIAARALQTILYDQECIVSSITHIEALKEIIPNKIDFKWEVPRVSFPCLVKLLEFDCYSKAVLSGMVISVGGLQDSLRKASLSALLDHIQHSEIDADGGKNTREYRLSFDFLWILKHYQKKDRVIVPTLKTIEIFFGNKVFLNMENIFVEFYVGVLDALVIELKATKDFSKLFTGLSILGYLASVSQFINARGFSLLLSFLGHRYPKIRKACADQVYLVILQSESLVESDKTEELLEIITETSWEGDLAEVKRRKSQVYALTGIKCETTAMSPKTDNAKSTSNDENLSYSSLVGFSGL